MGNSLLRVGAIVVAIGVLGLAACSSKPGMRAPVEDIGRTAHSASTRAGDGVVHGLGTMVVTVSEVPNVRAAPTARFRDAAPLLPAR